MGNLNGKYAVVSGGSRGIGEAIVQRFLEDGAAGVAVLARSADGETAQRLDPTGKRVLALACDVGRADDVNRAIAQVLETFGAVDILVNNSGITRDSMFHKMSREDWDGVFQVNLGGPYHLCRALIPLMRERSYGRIVNVVSISAVGGAVGQANYVASKAAVIGLTKTLAKEGGMKNITVNCIAPGYIDTDMTRAMPPDILGGFIKQVPMKRIGRPEEIASVASFLASDDSSYLTGECLSVSGGLVV